MNRFTKLVSGLVATFVFSASAIAVPILSIDQPLDGERSDFNDYPTSALAQTFTATLTGGLTEIILSMDGDGDTGTWSLDIFNVSSGVPFGSAFGGATVDSPLPNGSRTPVSFDFSLSLPQLIAGQMYAWVLTNPDGDEDDLYGANTTYDGGEAFFLNSSDEWVLASTEEPLTDFAFQLFVDPDAVSVPNPSSLALIGLGMLILRIRRK